MSTVAGDVSGACNAISMLRRHTVTTIEDAILHRVTPSRNPGGLDLADLTSVLSTETKDFLTTHAQTVLSDRLALAAVFDGAGIREHIEQALNDRDSLVSASRQLASSLHQRMSHPRTPPGHLAMVKLTAVDGDGRREDFIALLKLDDTTGFAPERAVEAEGVRYNFTEREGMLPQPGKKLQKAAIIGRIDGVFQMLVVDKQVAEAAKFWMEFLGAKARMDEAERTRALGRALREAMSETLDMVSAEEHRRIREIVRSSMQQEQVDLPSLVNGLPGEDRVRSVFESALDAELDVTAVVIDPDVRERELKTSVWRGDYSLRVSIDGTAATSHIKAFSGEENIELSGMPQAAHTIVIRTDKWNPVK